MVYGFNTNIVMKEIGARAPATTLCRSKYRAKGRQPHSGERRATPQGMTKKEYRHSLLYDTAQHFMQNIQPVDCATFDWQNFSFVPAALHEDDL